MIKINYPENNSTGMDRIRLALTNKYHIRDSNGFFFVEKKWGIFQSFSPFIAVVHDYSKFQYNPRYEVAIYERFWKQRWELLNELLCVSDLNIVVECQ